LGLTLVDAFDLRLRNARQRAIEILLERGELDQSSEEPSREVLSNQIAALQAENDQLRAQVRDLTGTDSEQTA
jgi:hypothetical protein